MPTQLTDPTPLKNYKGKMTENGLLVKGVELSVIEVEKFGPTAITQKEAEQFVAGFKLRQAKQKVGAFVRLNHGGPGIGKITDLYVDGPFIKGDLLITNPKAIKKIEAGDLTERSIEWAKGMFTAVALLDGGMGVDSEEFRDFTVDIEKEFGLSAAPLTKQFKQEKEVALTPEDIEMIKGLIADALESQDTPAPAVESEDVEEEVQVAVEKAMSEHRKALEETKAKHEVDTYVMALSTDDMIYTPNQLRKMFNAKSTEEGREELFKRLKLMTKEDIKVEIERDFEKPSAEKILREEYAKSADQYKSLGVTEDQYVEMNREYVETE